MFQAFLPVRSQKITGKTICDNREMPRQKQGKFTIPTAIDSVDVALPKAAPAITIELY
jgi:hypothetical protein